MQVESAFWTAARLHLTKDAIFHWEVETLSRASILAMSISDGWFPLHRAVKKSVIGVGRAFEY